MQTFVPYDNYRKSAQVLDRARLGKQRVEGYQILMALSGLADSKAWKNHPATIMWRKHELALIEYLTEICMEWRNRGYKCTTLEKIQSLSPYFSDSSSEPPPWFGDDRIHKSHRDNLLRKDPAFYGPKFKDANMRMEYLWPSKMKEYEDYYL